MTVGYIKINGVFSMIFLDKSDLFIQEKVETLRTATNNMQILIEWDNFYSDRRLDELESFMRTK